MVIDMRMCLHLVEVYVYFSPSVHSWGSFIVFDCMKYIRNETVPIPTKQFNLKCPLHRHVLCFIAKQFTALNYNIMYCTL